jgi:NTE family protein
VLSGGGARGAYEAGVMSVLSPALDDRGERPNIFIGTSVGAINAAYLAASEHLPPDEAAEGGLERWRQVTKGRVVRPILLRQAPLTALRYAGEILSLPGVRLPSLLDPRPLERNLQRWIDWDAVHSNIDEDRAQVLACVATGARTGRTVVFLEGHGERVRHRSHAIDYVETRLDDQHVRASAAIPILFPPVRVEHPQEARGWYFDGGTRLNTPIKPALKLDAERLIVIGLNSVAPAPKSDQRPDLFDGASQIVQGLLVDPVVNDVETLATINETLIRGAKTASPGSDQRKVVPYIFISPRTPDQIGEIAGEVYREYYHGVRGMWRSRDLALLGRVVGPARSSTRGELFSYLFFAPEFAARLIDLGRDDAQRWIDQSHDDGAWQLRRLPRN